MVNICQTIIEMLTFWTFFLRETTFTRKDKGQSAVPSTNISGSFFCRKPISCNDTVWNMFGRCVLLVHIWFHSVCPNKFSLLANTLRYFYIGNNCRVICRNFHSNTSVSTWGLSLWPSWHIKGEPLNSEIWWFSFKNMF